MKLILSLCICIFAVLSNSQNVLAGPRAIYQYLVGKDLINHTYDQFLDDFFNEAERRGDLPAYTAGQMPNASVISVFVLSAKQTSSNQKIPEINIDIGDAGRNFLAVQPNLILAGENILADIILNSMNDMLAHVQSPQLADDPKVAARLESSLATFLRMNNIRNSIKKLELERYPTSLSPLIVNNFREVIGPKYINVFYYGLLFIFAHENAHLDEKRTGQFIDPWDIVLRWRQDRILAEERRADEVARVVIRKSLQSSNSSDDVISLVSVADYMRDYMNIDIFDDLRPVNAAELFFTFVHRDCSLEANKQRNVRTDDIDIASDGYWNILPILSRREYAIVRQKLLTERSRATHEHNFFRTGNIQADLTTLGYDLSFKSPIGPFIQFYQSLLEDKPYITSATVNGQTSLTKTALYSFLGSITESELSPVCGMGVECTVGSFGSDGFMEAITDAGTVKYAEIYLPVKWANLSGSDVDQASAVEYFQNVAMMLRLYANLRQLTTISYSGSDEEEGKLLEREVSELRMKIRTCGFFYKVYEGPNDVVEISTMRAGEWARFKIYPKSHDIHVLN